ncbi:hypothetical protein [uncultured Methanobacterium sp.]|nr:hypothetical protein [uncultured Methanobacterium sp.]
MERPGSNAQNQTPTPTVVPQEKKVDPAHVKSVDNYLEKRGLVKFF